MRRMHCGVRSQVLHVVSLWLLSSGVLTEGNAQFPRCDCSLSMNCSCQLPHEAFVSLEISRKRGDARTRNGEERSRQSVGLDILLVADIGRAREHAALLSSPFPMGFAAVNGSFSVYEGIQQYIQQQGARPTAIIIAGDVGYGGGSLASTTAMRESLQQYTNGFVSEDMMFPAIGNHDVHYMGCTTLPQYLNIVHPLTCFYGDSTFAGYASKFSMGFSTWRSNWLAGFPGLDKGANVILPPRVTHGTCATTGGTANGAPCSFPFTHRFEEWNGCITKNHDRPWCYTADGTWGECSSTCTPEIETWIAPNRYNLDISSNSSVYIIVGLIAGAELTDWNKDTPPASVPVGGPSGSQAECKFLGDSLAHGKSLGKTVFVYVTHWLQEGCEDWSLIQQLDVWVYGHDHAMWQSPAAGDSIVQENRYFPVRFLIGNGGFDSGQSNAVSFVHLTETRLNGRTKLSFNVFDTCLSDAVCPRMMSQIADCWYSCKRFPDSDTFHGRKAVPSSLFGFVYDAPESVADKTARKLDFVAKLQIESKWLMLASCPQMLKTYSHRSSTFYRSSAISSLVDPHAATLRRHVANLSIMKHVGIPKSVRAGLKLEQSAWRCFVPTDDVTRATRFRFYDVSSSAARLVVDSESPAPVVRSRAGGAMSDVLMQSFGFYDMHAEQPTPPHTGPSGFGMMRPQDGHLFDLTEDPDGSFRLSGVSWSDGLLRVEEGAVSPMIISRS